jgi:hypothetical protein
LENDKKKALGSMLDLLSLKWSHRNYLTPMKQMKFKIASYRGSCNLLSKAKLICLSVGIFYDGSAMRECLAVRFLLNNAQSQRTVRLIVRHAKTTFGNDHLLWLYRGVCDSYFGIEKFGPAAWTCSLPTTRENHRAKQIPLAEMPVRLPHVFALAVTHRPLRR